MTDHDRSMSVRAYALQQVGGPYIYGATAKECTPAYRRARAGQYPEYEAKIVKACPVLSGSQQTCDECVYQGRAAHDCAQLNRFSARAAGLDLPSGATSQWRKGDWAASGEIGTIPEGHVCFVYRANGDKMQHTGVYLGDGTVADARGHAYGVMHKPLTAYKWTHWAILKGMELPANLPKVSHMTLRKGDSGGEVQELQELLIRHGHTLEADGVYGTKTRAAVKAFQQKNGLTADGICGPMTWAALTAGQTRYTVTVRHVVKAVADRLVDEYGGEAVVEGGDDNG